MRKTFATLTIIFIAFTAISKKLDFTHGKPIVSPNNFFFTHFMGQTGDTTILVKKEKKGDGRSVEYYDSDYNVVFNTFIKLEKKHFIDTLFLDGDQPKLIFHFDDKKAKKRKFYVVNIPKNGVIIKEKSKLLAQFSLVKVKKTRPFHVTISKNRKS